MFRFKKLLFKVISFSKTEANGAILLMLLILFCLAAPMLYKGMFGVKYSSFEEDKVLLDSLMAKFKVDTASVTKPEIILKPFNPNEATVEELTTVGIPAFLSRRIENFRKAGGTFKVKSDLGRIYDFPDSLFQNLKAYISLPDELNEPEPTIPSKSTQSVKGNQSAKTIFKKSRYDEEPFLVDINQADTTEFQKLHGVGPAYARRLASFREALGGFHSVDQVKDLYGMTDSLFYQIKSFLHVSDTVTLKSLSINIATFEQLNAHPYISYELTKEILASKSKYGKFRRVEDLKRLKKIDSLTIAKLAPYLKF